MAGEAERCVAVVETDIVIQKYFFAVDLHQCRWSKPAIPLILKCERLELFTFQLSSEILSPNSWTRYTMADDIHHINRICEFTGPHKFPECARLASCPHKQQCLPWVRI